MGPDALFARFHKEPVASASVGQVHVAYLHDGRKVAVKVQYPDIEDIVKVDLRVLRFIFRVMGRLLPDWGFDMVYREVKEMVLSELDFRKEAAALKKIGGHFEDRSDIAVPEAIEAFCSERVLTSTWMEGRKVGDREGLLSDGICPKGAARLCLEAYCEQIFVFGHYHADPHPGNLLLRRGEDGNPVLIFLDFGAVAWVSDGMKAGMMSLLQGVLTQDSNRLVTALREMGFIGQDANPEVFDRIVEHFHAKFRAQFRLKGCR